MKITVDFAGYAEDKFWFNYPDVEITVTDNDVICQLHMESELNFETTGIQPDPVLSKYLNAHVYYLSKKNKNDLIKLINANCNLDINMYIFTMKIHIENDTFIVTESDGAWVESHESQIGHCKLAQRHYGYKDALDSEFYRAVLKKMYHYYYHSEQGEIDGLSDFWLWPRYNRHAL